MLWLENRSSLHITCKVLSLPFASIALCWGLSKGKLIPWAVPSPLCRPSAILGEMQNHRFGCQPLPTAVIPRHTTRMSQRGNSHPQHCTPTCGHSQPRARPAHLAERMCMTLGGSPGCACGYTDMCEIRSSSALLLHLLVHSSKLCVPRAGPDLTHKLKAGWTELVLSITS